MKTEAAILEELDDKLSTMQLALQVEVDKASIELAAMRRKIEPLNRLYEARLVELDNFHKLLSPRFSIVRYAPANTEFFRASFRFYDQVVGKSMPRVVHIGPIKDYKDENDPELYSQAKKQILKYLMNRYPGLYDSI
jgi:hypothetical protein